MKNIRFFFFWSSFAALAVTSVFFQNCSKVVLSYDESSTTLNKTAENGGPYGGMAKIYRYFNSVQPCSIKDLKGQPLPNTEILFKFNASGVLGPYLARENCADLGDPTAIDDGAIQVLDSSLVNIRYNNITLSSANPPGDFDVVAPQCPSGLIEIPNSARANIFVHSFDWLAPMDPSAIGSDWRFQPNATLGWTRFPGVGVSLSSTVQSLPAFSVVRNDAGNLDSWRRQSQYVQLKANTDYAFSFVARAGSVKDVDVILFRSISGNTNTATDETFLLTFDLQNGSINTQYIKNVTGVSATATPFGGGYFVTVYFRSTATAGNDVTNIGFAPSASGQPLGQLGDSILGTAAQLVEVRSYCQ